MDNKNNTQRLLTLFILYNSRNMSYRADQVKRMRDIELSRGNFDEMKSFHADFQNIPWIVVRNLNYSLSEGDICTVFEQYGTITQMELLRDEETGSSKGTAFICYEDWRSTILAVDNLNGITLIGRTISVDHVKYEVSQKSKLVDPRTLVPARLQADKNAEPVFDEGSASETETDTE